MTAPVACLTGLRRDDLLRLEWSHVGDIAITLTPNKSRRTRKKPVIIPLLDETLELLDEIRQQQRARWKERAERAEKRGAPTPMFPSTVLSNTRAQRWSKDGAEHQVIDTKHKACIDKHLHDRRGSFATRLRIYGATTSEIADILGWEEARVERLLALYVDSETVARAFSSIERGEARWSVRC